MTKDAPFGAATVPRSKGEYDMRALHAATVLALALLATSCTEAPSSDGKAGSMGIFGIVTGNGMVETESRGLPGFTSVSLSGIGSLRIHSGAFKVEVTSDSNILPYIVTEVVGSELRIGMKPGIRAYRPTRIEYDVTLPALEGIGLSGSGSVHIDRSSGESFRAHISGSGSLEGELSYGKASMGVSGSGAYSLSGDFGTLDLDISGSGSGVFSGTAKTCLANISGSGSISGKDFSIDALKATISGSGDLELRVKERLQASVSGSGSIGYWGKPTVDAHTSGSGRIRSLGD